MSEAHELRKLALENEQLKLSIDQHLLTIARQRDIIANLREHIRQEAEDWPLKADIEWE